MTYVPQVTGSKSIAAAVPPVDHFASSAWSRQSQGGQPFESHGPRCHDPR